jgi:hypothetical protein
MTPEQIDIECRRETGGQVVARLLQRTVSELENIAFVSTSFSEVHFE